MGKSVSHESRWKRNFLFAALYFSEGAPIGYIWWAMPTRLRAAGMPVEDVAALVAMLTLPWAFKFLWAPAVDALRTRRWGYRCWVTAAQILMGLTLLPLALMPLGDVVEIAAWLLLAHAFCAATQDVAIDALAVSSVAEHDFGKVTGWMQAGMLIGRAIFGGLALAAESWIGGQAVVLILVLCIWFSIFFVWRMPAITADRDGGENAAQRFVQSLLRALMRRSTWIGVAIALTVGAGFEAVGGLMGPWLIDQDATQEAIGFFLAVPVVGCMIVGALAGGWLADRLGHRTLIRWSVMAIAAGVVVLLLTSMAGGPTWAVMLAALPVYLCTGALTASSYALFMDLTDPAIGGTQFSAFMGAMNLCEVWAVAAAGRLAGMYDYTMAFAVIAAASLIALVFLPMLKEARDPSDAQAAPSDSVAA
ncbi:MAG: MFS transporter [Phycisphaerales bacterium]